MGYILAAIGAVIVLIVAAIAVSQAGSAKRVHSTRTDIEKGRTPSEPVAEQTTPAGAEAATASGEVGPRPPKQPYEPFTGAKVNPNPKKK